MKKAFLPLIAASMLLSPSAEAQQTKVLTPDKLNEYGLVYSLPVTALQITITARKTTLIAGPYANYAKKYLAAENVISENGESWEILDVNVTPYGAVDPESHYLMQLKSGSTTFISVAADGMLLSINKETSGNIIEPNFQQPRTGTKYTGREYLQFVDEDFIASQSSAKQAEMLASSIMEVRDARLSLTRGTADSMPTDGRQLELMLNSLNEQERAMTAAFIGCSNSEIVSRTYSYVPEEDSNEILIRFSDFKGFCNPDDYAGAPLNIRVNVTAQGVIPKDPNGKEKEMPKDGVRYCIPGSAQITLAFDGETLYNKELEFSQFGIVYALNPSLFTDKKDPAYAIFSPVTGSLVELGSLKDK